MKSYPNQTYHGSDIVNRTRLISATSKVTSKPAFSIDNLLGNRDQESEVSPEAVHEDTEADEVAGSEDDEKPLPLLVKPTPVLLPPPKKNDQSLEDVEVTEPEDGEPHPTSPESTSAIAAALHGNLFYTATQPTTNFLYSQWLATRNTSALFGLQGENCHLFIIRLNESGSTIFLKCQYPEKLKFAATIPITSKH